VRWGIIGAADIATKFCHGASLAPNAIVAAVASRSLEKGKAFVEKHAPGATAYDSYEALLADPQVEAVYIPLPTALRKEWVLKAAQAKKHVDCEKPLAGNFKDAAECVQACRDAGVQWMDNTMLMHHPRQAEMKEVVQKGELGRIKHVVSTFSIPFGNTEDWSSSNIRMNPKTEPLGALGDLGWYNVRVSLWAFDWELPEDVCCHFLEASKDGVPITIHALLRYSGGRSATFDCSFKCTLRQWAEVVGEKRTLSWEDCCVPQSVEEPKYTVAEAEIAERGITFPKTFSQEHTAAGCVQHAKLIENMSTIIRSGKVDTTWADQSILTQRVLIACYTSGKAGGAWVRPADVDDQ